MVGTRDTNDPEEILKDSLHGILTRLIEDSKKLRALGEVDKEVLRRLTEKGIFKPENAERLEDASRSMRAVTENASRARHALNEIRENP